MNLKISENYKHQIQKFMKISREKIIWKIAQKGIFVKRKKDGKISSEGLAVLGIPLQYKIPEWIIPYIDYATVINSVMAPFKSVTETFNIPSIDEGRTDRKSSGFSNIIRI